MPGTNVSSALEEQNIDGDAARIANLIRAAGRVSRGELAQRTGLSRTAVAARLKLLESLGLVRDVGAPRSTGGRPASLVEFAEDAGLVVGVDLGATSVDVGLTGLAATPLEIRGERLDVRNGPTSVLERCDALIDALLADHSVEPERIRGLGIGLPGPVEFATGRPVSPPIMPGWDQYPVLEHFRDNYGCPVVVDNDVNVMAQGEQWAGAGADVDDFLWIKLGTGIGCGIVTDGRPFRGKNGCAGDIGHIAVGDDQTLCSCGKTGCLEAIAGGAALGRAAETLALMGESPALSRLREERGSVTAVEVGVAAAQGDLAAVELIRSAGTAIGRVLAGLINFYNPELVIVGGGVADISDLMLAAIREAVYGRSAPLATRELVIAKSSLGGRAGVIGAAAMVVRGLYSLEPLRN